MGALEMYTESGEYARATEYEKEPSFWSKAGSYFAEKALNFADKSAEVWMTGTAQKLYKSAGGGSGGGPQPGGQQPGQQPATIYLPASGADTSRYPTAHYAGDPSNRTGLDPTQRVNSDQYFERPETARIFPSAAGILSAFDPTVLILLCGAAVAGIFLLKR